MLLLIIELEYLILKDLFDPKVKNICCFILFFAKVIWRDPNEEISSGDNWRWGN